VLATRANFPADYTAEELTKVVSLFLKSLSGKDVREQQTHAS
jgi:hypothetical protein